MEPPDNYFHRNLPHYHPNDAPYFVTFRLKNSLSRMEVERLKLSFSENTNSVAYARFFKDYDALLGAAKRGPKYLARPDICAVVRNSFTYIEDRWLDLIAYSIMPNHVHFVGSLKGERSLSQIMHSLKGFTAREANRLLGKTGIPFWQPESYDRVIRKGRLASSVIYTLNNPVKAGLVERWDQWPGNYLAERYNDIVIVNS